MSIKYVVGDATQPQGEHHRLIVHICNDIGAWGRGFVLALSARWPLAEARYRAWHRSEDMRPFALGEVQFVEVAAHLWVAHLIRQHGIRSRGGVPPIRYDAVRHGLQHVASFAQAQDASVHMPRIGAGLAGGDWAHISAIVDEELIAHGVAVTVYDLRNA